MTLFKSKTVSWQQIGLLKLSVLSIGIAIGAQWSVAFAPYILMLAGFGVVLGLCSLYLWAKN